MKMDAEAGVMHLQAKEHLGLLVNSQKLEEARKDSFLEVSEGPWLADPLISGF